MSNPSLRVAREEDLPRLVDIYNEVILEGGFTADLRPYTIAQRRPWFNDHLIPPFQIHLVIEDDLVLGYFYLSPWRDGRAAMRQVAEVSYYLTSSARGRGVGRFMLQQAQLIAKNAGIRHLLAVLLDINTGSRSLLEKEGFSQAGHLPDIANLGETHCGQFIMLKDLKKVEQ